MNEKKKLKLIKYNKNLKKRIDITLNNYIYFSEKYIIFENGIGKEFSGYDDELYF